MNNDIMVLTEENLEETKEVNKEKKEIHISKTLVIVGKIHEAPEFLRDNEYIHSGYRINFNSAKHIFKSLFMLHNEFVNVWSHLLGAALLIFLIIYTTIYIKSHKTELYEILDSNWENINDEWNSLSYSFRENIPSFKEFSNELKSKYEDGKVFINEYTAKLKNKTIEYYNTMDAKLNEYKNFINQKVR
jgi:adiponectin receptor